MNEEIRKVSEQIKEKIGGRIPDLAVILGSGLGGFADQIKNPITIPYDEIAGFPRSTVPGHEGKLIFGEMSGKNILCMQGRVHLYEGNSPKKIALILRAFKNLGIGTVIITNASGSLRENVPPGSLVLITDHINFSFCSPLVGENDDNVGPRFLDMTEAYPKKLRDKMHEAARKEDIDLKEGTYMMVMGPTFETPAEIKAFRTLGAEVIGMSTVPEVISAVHCGMEVVTVATITNFGAGMQAVKLSHKETVAQANLAGAKLQRLIAAFIRDF